MLSCLAHTLPSYGIFSKKQYLTGGTKFVFVPRNPLILLVFSVSVVIFPYYDKIKKVRLKYIQKGHLSPMRINLNHTSDITAKNESTTFLMIRFAVTGFLESGSVYL